MKSPVAFPVVAGVVQMSIRRDLGRIATDPPMRPGRHWPARQRAHSDCRFSGSRSCIPNRSHSDPRRRCPAKLPPLPQVTMNPMARTPSAVSPSPRSVSKSFTAPGRRGHSMWRVKNGIRALTNIAAPGTLSSVPHRRRYNPGAQSRFDSRTGEGPCSRSRSTSVVRANVLRLPWALQVHCCSQRTDRSALQQAGLTAASKGKSWKSGAT